MKSTLIILSMLLSIQVYSQLGVLGNGKQPQIAVAKDGVIRMVYGNGPSVMYTFSTNNGVSFSTPKAIANIEGLALGMDRCPQIVSSAKTSLVAAIDKEGNINTFLLNHETGNWKKTGKINDIKGSGTEGFVSLTADENDTFYAVWLDIRTGKGNNICFSKSTGGEKWAANKMVYTNPDGSVCPCCKPNIAFNNGTLAIMFRNSLEGNRDMYLLTSKDGGNTFSQANKLGTGSWKLNACPMDGGNVYVDNTGTIHTFWRREGNLYYCKPGSEEVLVAPGKSGYLSGDKTLNFTWHDGINTKMKMGLDGAETIVSEGNYIKSKTLNNGAIILAWENNGKINFQVK